MDDLTNYANAIGSIESSNNYGSIGPLTKSNDRAYGRYQVMGSNIPAWTQSALGTSLTPQQFLNNPDAQDAVFNNQFGNAVKKYGNANDAASVWFSGRPLSQAGNASDGYITAPEYVRRFNAALGGLSPMAAPQQPALASAMPQQQPDDTNPILSVMRSPGFDNAMTGVQQAGAYLTSIANPSGGAALLNATNMPMFRQRYSVVRDPFGNQRVFDLRRGMFVDNNGNAAPGQTAQNSQQTPDVATALAQTPAALAERLKNDQETSSKKMDALEDAATQAQTLIDQANQAKRLSQDPNVHQGAYGDVIAGVKNAVGSVTGGTYSPQGTDQSAELDKLNKQLQAGYLGMQKGVRFAGPEIKFGETANADLDKPAAVNQQIYDDMIQNAQRAIAARDIARAHMQTRGVLGPAYSQDLQTYMQAHPIYQDTAVHPSQNAPALPKGVKSVQIIPQ